MKATKDHISLETAKLLKDCGVESKDTYQMQFALSYYTTIGKSGYGLKDKILREIGEDVEFPAFSWQEILWEYPKSFFGGKNHYQVTINSSPESGFDYIATEILILLQQQKYDEADLYFRKNCILTHT